MILNPILFIALTIISLVLGSSALGETDNLLVMIPALVFLLLFFISLVQPVKWISAVRDQALVKIPIQLQKLTAGRLRTYRAGKNTLSPALRPSATEIPAADRS